MPSIRSILSKLQNDYPQLLFRASDTFYWSPSKHVIYYAEDSNDAVTLLHETAHALLGHNNYERDIQLLGLESEAWEYARTTLAPTYNVALDSNAIEDDLDSYREWMHQRSACPNCSAIGAQTSERDYLCLACQNSWRVNEARTCALRRCKQKR